MLHNIEYLSKEGALLNSYFLSTSFGECDMINIVVLTKMSNHENNIESTSLFCFAQMQVRRLASW